MTDICLVKYIIGDNNGEKYVFENREQLIELLSLCIELVNKHFYRYRVYYDELISMAKDKIKEISNKDVSQIDDKDIETEILNIMEHTNYITNHNKYKIDYIEYKSMEDKILNVAAQLLNLLGDRTKKGVFHIGDLDMNIRN